MTIGSLYQVEQAESALRSLGFGSLRVRHYGELARIEFEERDIERAVVLREEVVTVVVRAGYRYVTLDLQGLRTGNLNAVMDDLNDVKGNR